MNIITETRYDAIRKALIAVQWDLYKNRVDITSESDRNNGHIITWGVNWSCMGTQEPQEAINMGSLLTHAAYVAEFLNGLELREVHEEDEAIQKLLDEGKNETAQKCFEDYAGLIEKAVLGANYSELKELILNTDIVK